MKISPTSPKYNTHKKIVLHFFIPMLLLPITPPSTYLKLKKIKDQKWITHLFHFHFHFSLFTSLSQPKVQEVESGFRLSNSTPPPYEHPHPPTIPFIISLFRLGMVGGLGTLVGGWGRVTEPKPALDLLHFWLLKKFPSKYSTCKTSPGFYIRNPFKNESDQKKSSPKN